MPRRMDGFLCYDDEGGSGGGGGAPADTPSMSQMQRDFMNTTQRLGQTVEQLRTRLDRFHDDLGDAVEAQVATILEARENGHAEEIRALKEQQQQLLLRINRPLGEAMAAVTVDEEARSLFANRIRWASGKAEVRDAMPSEARALVEDTTGEIAVPEDLEAEWIKAIGTETVFRALVDVKTTRSNRMRKRSRTKVTVGMGKLELGDDLHESDMDLDEEWQYVEDMHGYTELGVDELADSDSNLVAFLTDDFTEGFVELEDTQGWQGTGHGNREFGGMSRGTTITRHAATSASVISIEDFLRLVYEVPQQYRRNGSLVIHSSTELGLMLLRTEPDGAGSGSFLWQPSVQVGVPNRLRGYPVYTQDDIDEWDGTSGNDVAIFGDLRRTYRLLDRQGMILTRFDELRRLAGMIGFLATRRVGGEIMIANASRIMRLP